MAIRDSLHPFAQIEAAQNLHGYVDAFVADEWAELYTDPPPDEEQPDEVVPATFLDLHATLGLRFDLAGYMKDEDDLFETYWRFEYQGSPLDVLLHGWAHKVMVHIALDDRALMEGLAPTDLVLVPDDAGVASAAYRCCSRATRQPCRNDAPGGKPGSPSVGGRIWIRRSGNRHAVKDLARNGWLWSTESLSRCANRRRPFPQKRSRIGSSTRTPPSVTTALHQVIAYRKPKRLAGWILRGGDGRYSWADAATSSPTSVARTRKSGDRRPP